MITPLPALERSPSDEMRASGVRGLLIYCSDYRCSHWTAISGDQWPDEVRLSDIEPRFACQACGRRGADVRPNFGWEREARQHNAAQAEYIRSAALVNHEAPKSPRA